MKKIISIILMMLAYTGLFAKPQVKMFSHDLKNWYGKFTVETIETQINKWLSEYPTYKIINVSIGSNPGYYRLIVCMTYDDGE